MRILKNIVIFDLVMSVGQRVNFLRLRFEKFAGTWNVTVWHSQANPAFALILQNHLLHL